MGLVRTALIALAFVSTARASMPQIYFITGGVWDNRTPTVLKGLNAFQSQLQNAGITSLQIIHNTHWEEICSQIVANGEIGPLTLIGHSLGGQAVEDVARCLGTHDRKVDLAITLDPMQKFFHPPVGLVPENVAINANFYQTQDIFWRGHSSNFRADGSKRGISDTQVVIPPGAGGSAHDWLVQYVGESALLMQLVQQYGSGSSSELPALAR